MPNPKKIYTLLTAGLMVSALTAAAQPSFAQDQDGEQETLGGAETIKREAPEPRYPPGLGPVTLLRPAGLLFASYDLDKNFSVSVDELYQGQQRSFTQADTNGDQSLSLFELEDWRLEALGHKDAMPGNLGFDTDFNRMISPREFAAELTRLYKMNDVDEDGQLAFSELVQVVERRQRDTRPPSLLDQKNSNQPYPPRGRR